MLNSVSKQRKLHYLKEYCQKNSEKVRRWHQTYRNKNLEKVREKNRKWYHAHKENLNKAKRQKNAARTEDEKNTQRQKKREYYWANRERIREQQRLRYACPEERKRIRAVRQKWRERNIERVHAYEKATRARRKVLLHAESLKRHYGLSLQQYNAFLRRQHNVCAICGNTNRSGWRLAVDHDHHTGRIRALLCHKCNLALGYLNEDPKLAQKLLRYMQQHKMRANCAKCVVTHPEPL